MSKVTHVYLSPKGTYRNGVRVPLSDPASGEHWLKSIYQDMELEYPKFYKMDTLSKMAVLGAELLKDELQAVNSVENELALIFANAASSMQTDLRFIDSYEEQGNPSPSLFVYTLPNILTGELAIRHKWYGENCFFITPDFDADLYYDQVQLAFSRGNNACLCGWVNADASGNEECFLFLIRNHSDDPIDLIHIINTYRNE